MRPIIVALTATLAACALYDTSDLSDADRGARVDTMFAEETGKFEVPVISIEDLKSRDDVVLVDVRPAEERSISMIPGAISREDFEASAEEYAGKPVATYCTIGYRSGEYAEALRARGVDSYNLEGSILGWIHAGEAVVDETGEPVKRLHVYGATWDLAPTDYETVY